MATKRWIIQYFNMIVSLEVIAKLLQFSPQHLKVTHMGKGKCKKMRLILDV